MKQIQKLLVLLLLLLAVAAPLAAKGYTIPAADYVVDQANIISSKDEAALKTYLSQLYDKTGVQICVLTLKSLNGASLEDYSLAVAEQWGIGKKGKDSGALLLVSMNEHAMRIEVGYGLEGDLTDARSGLIIRKVLTPYFKDGDYSTGIVAGVEAMAQAAAGDAAGTVSGASKTNRSYSVNDADYDSEDLADVITVLAIIFIIFLKIISSARHASRYRGYGYSRRRNDSLWRDLFWLSMLSNNNHRGGRGGHSGGGFSGGSFGG
ncbi:MAG: TPM domain-containing protein, partial [Treponemataceae bacterium]|nr:TPM domain-containing protein [Treponemataceae bacterium]